MPLPPGTRIGPYETSALLGVGGMGEVYRARDTRLGRDVALKLLPESFAGDPDRLARFRREAELAASLNHPNIAGIYGLEETGRGRALVMELVEGETLQEKLRAVGSPARGLPVDDALSIARQIAEALEAAHDHGIVHRDLKPANVKVRSDGTVKVLDFGLAKATEAEAGSRDAAVFALADSLTMSRAATSTGVILGTAAYMSPEQAKGVAVDRRSDLFAFGAVLYEMLTGRPVFAGESVAEVLASVIRATPVWENLPADTPPGLQRLLQRCLEKDRRQRLQTAADARIRIDEVAQELQSAESPATAAKSARSGAGERRTWAWGIVALLSTALIALAVPSALYYRAWPGADTPEMRLEISTPITTEASSFALSPDGRQIAFVAGDGGSRSLWVRRLDATAGQALAGTAGAASPFWAPDNRSIGFFADGQLKRVDLGGGAPQALTYARSTGGDSGSWGPDGTILLPQTAVSGLVQIPASGAHRWW